MIDVWVPGRPRPQGSMRMVNRRTGRMVHSDNMLQWRNVVAWTVKARAKGEKYPTGPVLLDTTFYFRWPKDDPKHTRFWRDKQPDLDKLIRAVCDALTAAGVISDDRQIVSIVSAKGHAADEGCRIVLRPLTAEPAATSVERHGDQT